MNSTLKINCLLPEAIAIYACYWVSTQPLPTLQCTGKNASLFLCRSESRRAKSSPEKEFPTADVTARDPTISGITAGGTAVLLRALCTDNTVPLLRSRPCSRDKALLSVSKSCLLASIPAHTETLPLKGDNVKNIQRHFVTGIYFCALCPGALQAVTSGWLLCAVLWHGAERRQLGTSHLQ